MMTNRSIRLAPALVAGLILMPACDILDVNNPNNLTEESIEAATAANALVNGAVAQNARGIATQWLGYLIATDEIVWIGSRDAWGQLDQGFVSNPANEFTDAAFPQVAQARWLADLAVTTLDGHVAEIPTNAILTDRARAYLQAGIIYTVIGETQEDFVFSNKDEAAPAVGPAQMTTVLDQAISYLDDAVTFAQELDDDDLIDRSLAMRARAQHSRAQWAKIKPSPNTADPLVDAAGAVSDALAVLARVGDDWRYQIEYSSSTLSNYMASEINSRGEQQFDTTSIVSVNAGAPKTILGVKLMDPIDDIPDPRILSFLQEWKGDTDIGIAGTVYAPLTIVSAKHMHLIVAEHALQGVPDMTTFATHINAVRAEDGLTDWASQIPALDMLRYERRAALFVTGVRMLDMYRFGITDPLWAGQSDMVKTPGVLLPITCIEKDSNPEIPDC